MRLGIVLVCAACGGGQPTAPDAAPIDAPTDAAARLAYRYVMNHQQIQARGRSSVPGLDLDGDRAIDNQVANVTTQLSDPAVDSQVLNERAVSRAVVIMMIELQVEDFTNGPATVELYIGDNPVPPACFNEVDLTCGKHLEGTGSFTIRPEPRTAPIAGRFVDGVFTSEPAPHALMTTVLGEDPSIFNLAGARLVLTDVTPQGIASGVIGGGITPAEIEVPLFLDIARRYLETVQVTCTSVFDPCGCPPGSEGEAIMQRFDTNPRDCEVTDLEIRADPEVASLLVTDVVIDGQPAMSYGMGFSAVSALVR